jgi:hypothetical protein
MIRLAVLLAALAIATPALAGNDDPTEIRVLRGTSAPPPQREPVNQPAPQPVVIAVPVYTPPVYYYYVPVRPVVIHHHHFRH